MQYGAPKPLLKWRALKGGECACCMPKAKMQWQSKRPRAECETSGSEILSDPGASEIQRPKRKTHTPGYLRLRAQVGIIDSRAYRMVSLTPCYCCWLLVPLINFLFDSLYFSLFCFRISLQLKAINSYSWIHYFGFINMSLMTYGLYFSNIFCLNS